MLLIYRRVLTCSIDSRGRRKYYLTIKSRTKKIVGIDEYADERANRFIDMCNYVYGKINTSYVESLFDLFSKVFVVES